MVQPKVGDEARPCEGEQSETRECPDIPDCPGVTFTTTTTATEASPGSNIVSELTTEINKASTSNSAISSDEYEDSAELSSVEDDGAELSSEERKILDESFIEKLLNAVSDVTTTRPQGTSDVITELTPEEVVVPALSSEYST